MPFPITRHVEIPFKSASTRQCGNFSQGGKRISQQKRKKNRNVKEERLSAPRSRDARRKKLLPSIGISMSNASRNDSRRGSRAIQDGERAWDWTSAHTTRRCRIGTGPAPLHKCIRREFCNWHIHRLGYLFPLRRVMRVIRAYVKALLSWPLERNARPLHADQRQRDAPRKEISRMCILDLSAEKGACPLHFQ